MKKTLTASLVAATFALSACGGGGGGRPSSDEISKAITSKDSVFGTAVPKTAADCVAKALVDSKLSDKTLRAIADGDKDYKGNDADKKAMTGLTSEFGKCVTG